MHADELEPEDPEEIVTEWEQQRRVKANSKADAEDYIRNWIIRKLQWEEEGNSVRRDRGLVFSVVSGVVVRAIWREFGECNCPRPGMCDPWTVRAAGPPVRLRGRLGLRCRSMWWVVTVHMGQYHP